MRVGCALSLGVRLFSVCLVAVCPFAGFARAESYVVPDQYVVQRKTSHAAALSARDVNYTVVQANEQVDVVIPSRYVAQYTASHIEDREVLNPAKVAADCAEILRDPTVETCEPEALFYPHIVPNDSSFSNQWHLDDPSDDGDVEAPTAWEKGMGDDTVLIGVLDTGVYWSHPDLLANMWTNPSEIADGIDNDANGYVDDIHGVNSATHTGDPNDPHGHGSHVAGIIGGRGNNGQGISGVMWRVSLVGVSATNSGSGAFTTSALVAGFNYLHDLKVRGLNVRAVNASFGGDIFSSALYNAISDLNAVDILVICAAGNDNTSNDSIPRYPADFDLPNIISVGATGPTVHRAGYSNYGNSVDIAAPGGDADFGSPGYIYSTYRSATPGQAAYARLQGTSMAAPVVTGAVGLLAYQRPRYTGAELRALLLSTADTVPALTSYVNSGRFLNVGAMTQATDPYDECPSDANKSAPGVCGCGVVENPADTDGDGSFDCQEGCPTDSNKTAPGACGCGISDADTNGNGTPDCLDPPDSCPSDSLKVEPGVCGCGVADDDLNDNGTADCLDPKVTGVTPNAPTVKAAKGKVTVAMTGMNGVVYAIKVTTLAPAVKGKPKPKPKTVYGIATATSVTFTKLKAKTKVSISYAYVVQGTPLIVSNYSAVKAVTVK